jgi:hypothetical protein
MKRKLSRLVRRLTRWAWQEKLDYLYTHEEVARWLHVYRGRQLLTLAEWVARERARAQTHEKE